MTQEVLINLDGKPQGGDSENAPKKALIADDVHEGIITDAVLLQGKNYDSGVEEPKIVINVKPNGIDGTISKWCTPKITKGSGNYSSSTLFTIAEKGNFLSAIAEIKDKLDSADKVAALFNTKLAGRKCKVLAKTVKSNEGVEYSKIDKFISIE